MKTCKRLIAVLLAMLMLVVGLPFAVSAESQTTVPEGYTAIYDIEDLYTVSYGLEGNYILMADIDLTAATAEGGEWDSGSGWAPIGETSSAPFKGIFDGNGHTITGMRIKNTSVTYVGLFGYINGGTVKNLRIKDANIEDSSVQYVGTIAGYANSATFENIAVDNLTMNVGYSGSSSLCAFGGIVGYTTGTNAKNTTISKSYVSGSITASCRDDYVGGIVGYCYQYTKITDCYNAASITANGYSSSYYACAGGISGYNGTITDCVNVGMISGSNSHAGAINYTGATLSQCYYKQGTAEKGRYNINDTVATAIALTEAQMKIESVFGDLDFENTWVLDVASGASYPQLKDNRQFAESGIRPPEEDHDDVIPEGYTAIYDVEDLYTVRYDLDGNYILMADIDLTAATAEGGEWDSGSGWAPIGETSSAPFKGIFDGNGHTITGMRIKDTAVAYVGLFGYIDNGMVKNLRMKDSNIEDSSVQYVGTIAGYANNATFENIAVDNLTMKVGYSSSNTYCYFGGIVGYAIGSSDNKTTISKSYVAGSITAGCYSYDFAGGIAGYCYSNDRVSITDCYNAATITVTGNSSSYYANAGGISGYYGTITNCINVGTISGTRYRAGAINYTGATLSQCYYKQSTASSGKYNTIDGLATVNSLTEEQMKLQSVYGWLDFENTWVLDVASGAAYPQLKDNRQFAESGIRPPEDEHDDVLPEGYIGIYDIEDLYAIRYNLDGNYILMADIDMTADTAADGDWSYDDDGWRPIGPNSSLAFTGIFDGNGHTIKGMRIKDTPVTYVGLFGYIDNGTVKNLRMKDSNIEDSSVQYVGTIAGYANNATFENIAVDNLTMKVGYSSSDTYCYFGGIVGYAIGASDKKTTISKSYVTGSITAGCYSYDFAGGIVGYCYSNDRVSITDCYNAAIITVTGNSSSYYANAGGISGYYGTITNCINVGTISGTRYRAGAINYTGATLSQCYYKQGTAAKGRYNTNDTAATAVALTEAQMKLQAVFGYLDFENTWFLNVSTGCNYPQLISNPEQKIVASITLKSAPEKVNYLQHDEFDVKGAKIEVSYAAPFSGTETIAVTANMVSGYDMTSIGTQTLTVSYMGKTATFDIIVAPRSVTSVTLDKESVTIEVGMTQQITATVLPDNATDKTLTWASDNTSVATVDTNGLITAVGTGTATINATTGSVSASVAITVIADHVFGEVITTVPATCISAGVAYKTCSVCGHVENIVPPIDSENHAFGTEVRDTVAANCGVAGFSGNTYCLGCNAKIADGSTVPATGNHNYTSEITTQSTCSVQGVRTYTCTVCSHSYTEAVEFDESVHTWGELEIIENATCEEDGYKAKRCTACGTEQSGIIVLPADTYPESSHNYSNNMNRTYEFSYPGAQELHLTFSYSTAFEYGYDYLYIYDANGIQIGRYTGTTLAGSNIAVFGDSFSLKLTSDSSNTGYGFSFTEIKAILSNVTEIIPATGHNYTSEVTTPATCSSEGVTTYTCSVCGDSYTQTIAIDANAHTWSEWETILQPTCKDDGYKVKRCSLCDMLPLENITLPSDTYPESEHNYVNYENETYEFSYPGAEKLYLTFSSSTYFESGYDYLYIYDSDGIQIGRYTGSSLADQTITIADDSFSLKLTSDSMYTYYGFSFSKIEAGVVDSDSENYEVVPSTGEHDYVGSTTKDATCSEEGEIAYTCSACGYSYTETTEKTAHTEEVIPASDATCSQPGLSEGKKCSVCGEITQAQTESGKLPHTEENIPEKAATCSEHGLTGGKKCSVCGTVTVEPVETPFGEHVAGEWQTITESTMDTAGLKVKYCTVCNAEVASEKIPAGTAADGKPLGYLGDVNTDGKITASDARAILRHSAKIENVPDSGKHLADINSDGKINASDARVALRMASKLENWFMYGSDDYHEHDYVTKITKEATCTKDGQKTQTCSICGDSKTFTIAKKGHSFKAATCTSPKKCTTCGVTEGSAAGHKYKTTSCAEPSKCTVCGTTTSAGYHYSDKNGKCTKCGKNLTGLMEAVSEITALMDVIVTAEGYMIDSYKAGSYRYTIEYAIYIDEGYSLLIDVASDHKELDKFCSYYRKAYNSLHNELLSMTNSSGSINVTQRNAYDLMMALDLDSEIVANDELQLIMEKTFSHLY